MSAWSAKRRNLTIAACVIAWAAALLVSLQPNGELSSNRYLPFYHLQAEALLDGRVDLKFPEGWWAQDAVEFEGRQYLAIGPLNGFLMVPYQALGLSERAFTLTLFTLLLLVLYRFITRHVAWHSDFDGALWIFGFSLGTMFLFCTAVATAWFSATLSGGLFLSAAGLMLLEVRAAIARKAQKAAGRPYEPYCWRSAATGALGLFCLALAGLSRFHLGILLPVFFATLAWPMFRDGRYKKTMHLLALLAAPVVFYAAFVLWWNWIRFGDPLSLKYANHQFAGHFQPWVDQFGFNSWRFVLPHVYHGLIGFPKLLPGWPHLQFDENGNGLFAMSPLFIFLIFRARRFEREDWWALGCAVLVSIPVFTLFTTGWRQFGYRYTLDFLPFLAFLLTRADFKIARPLPIVLVTAAIVLHAAAALLFI
ncbi:MAG TPA: hypothetical protein VFV50_05295 [Bdellovibrionales bacterium]|nr:hypothetical protein [Bdellovibrionales bacterium]